MINLNIGDLLLSHMHEDNFVIGWIVQFAPYALENYYIVQWSDRDALDTHAQEDVLYFRKKLLSLRKNLKI